MKASRVSSFAAFNSIEDVQLLSLPCHFQQALAMVSTVESTFNTHSKHPIAQGLSSTTLCSKN
jgi:hypothetical protein